MASKDGLSMRSDNKGLTVKVNLFPPKVTRSARRARVEIRGQVTNADTKDALMFNDAGELITILGKWNAEKLKQRKAEVAD